MAVMASYWTCDGLMSRTACYISADDSGDMSNIIRYLTYKQDVLKITQYNVYKTTIAKYNVVNSLTYKSSTKNVISFVQYAQKTGIAICNTSTYEAVV